MLGHFLQSSFYDLLQITIHTHDIFTGNTKTKVPKHTTRHRASKHMHRLQIGACVYAVGEMVGHPYHFPNLHPGPCSSVGIWRGTDR